MPDVYAQTFHLTQRRTTTLFVAVSETLRSWLREKWPPGNEWFVAHGSATVQLSDGTTLIWEPWEKESRSFLDFTMRQPSSGTSAYEWRTRVTLLAEGAEGVLQLRIENTGPEFGQAGAELTMRPKLASLIGLFCEATCDGHAWQSKAHRPFGSDALRFAREDLANPQRKDPVVVMSRPSDGPFIVSPDRMASWVATAARVVALAPEDTWAVTSELGKALSVFGGALRIYLPGLTRLSDPVRHPLVLRHRLGLRDEQARVAQWLALLTTRRFRDDPRRLAWRDTMQLAETARRVAREHELQEALSRAAESHDTRELLSLFEVENHELRNSLASRDADIASLKERIQYQEDTLRRLRYALEQRGVDELAVEEAASPSVPDLQPNTALDAVLIAKEQFEPALVFLDSAAKAASESDFLRPEDILEALRSLANIAERAGRPERLGQSLIAACRADGLDYAKGLAKQTPAKIRGQYVFSDGSRDYKCFEHLRLGGGGDSKTNARIYFSSERLRDGVIVIGHVGRHLDVITTN